MLSKGESSETKSRRQYLKGLAGSTLLTTGLAGCLGMGDSGGEGGNGSLKIGLETHTTSGGWASAMMDATEFYAADRGFDFEIFTNGESLSKQISNIKQMVNQGYDGILVVTFDTEGSADAIDQAVNDGVPVFTMDSDAAAKSVGMHVSWDGTKAASHSAELLTEKMRKQRPDQGSYNVLEIRAPPGRDIARRRHEPFVKSIENVDGVKIVGTVDGEWRRGTAKEKALQWINSHEAPDGLYAASYLMGLGGQDALKELGLQKPKTSDAHITQVHLDGSPQTHKLIKNGYIDTAVDQPVHYYGPLALLYMERYIKNGKSAIPEMETTIKSDDITLEPGEHKGTTLWDKPIWAPGTMQTAFDHPWFVTNSIDITEKNADAPYLWGNIWGQSN